MKFDHLNFAILAGGPTAVPIAFRSIVRHSRNIVEPRKAWKMVDLEHAEAVALGSIKVGCLRSYEHIENGRADPLDGKVRIHNNGALFYEIPEDRAIMEQMGLVSQFAYGNRLTRRLRDGYAFCMAEEGCDFDWSPEKPKAIFEVSDVDALMRILFALYPSRFEAAVWGHVEYAEREFDARKNPGAQPSAFIKSLKFTPEREIRIAFDARPGALFDDIFTGPNEQIAALLTRLR